jgi:hypothetical protein
MNMKIKIKILSFTYHEIDYSNIFISYIESLVKTSTLITNEYCIWFDIHKKSNKIVSYIDIENVVIKTNTNYESLYFNYYNN